MIYISVPTHSPYSTPRVTHNANTKRFSPRPKCLEHHPICFIVVLQVSKLCCRDLVAHRIPNAAFGTTRVVVRPELSVVQTRPMRSTSRANASQNWENKLARWIYNRTRWRSCKLTVLLLKCKLGMQIIARGPPYVSKQLHLFWPDHQSFVEELSNAITGSPRPKVTPPPLLVYKGPDALKNWNKKGPPMGTLDLSKRLLPFQLINCIVLAITFQTGDDAVSDEWTGGKGMLCAYPGGPGRIRKHWS